MAYVPTTWATGDIITAEKLNNIENGIESANNSLFIITVTNLNREQGTFTIDKTWNELKAAYENGKHVIMRYSPVTTPVSVIYLFYEVTANSILTDTNELESLDFTRYDVEGNNVISYTRMSINATNTSYYNIKFTIPTST